MEQSSSPAAMLVFDIDEGAHDELISIMEHLECKPALIPVTVRTPEAFAATLATQIWDFVLINFQTSHFLGMSHAQITAFITATRAYTSRDDSVLGCANDQSLLELLAAHNVPCIKKTYDFHTVAQLFKSTHLHLRSYRRWTTEEIQQFVANDCKIPLEELMKPTREREIVAHRQIIMYLSRFFSSETHVSIGKKCGGKDHSTVIHAIRAVRDRMDTEEAYRANVLRLEWQLRYGT